MQNNRRVVILAIVFAAVLIVAGVAYTQLSGQVARPEQSASSQTEASDQSVAPQQTQSTQQAPARLADYDATVYTQENDPKQLTAIADGRPLVINFWATWCPYCVQEMPDYNDLYAEFGDRVAFAFVDVADGQRERPEDALTWLEQQGLSHLPVYFDNDLAASYAFGAYSLPTTVVVSGGGEILGASAGAIDPELMRNTLNTLV